MTFNAYETSGDAGTPVELYKFTMGASAFYYTSADSPYAKDGARYIPEALSRTDIEHNIEDTSGTMTVTLPADNPVSLLFQKHLPTRPVYIELYRLHTTDADSQFVLVYSGTVSAAVFSDYACELTCRPVSYRLAQQVPSTLFQAQCTRTLYSQSQYYTNDSTKSQAAQTTGCGVSKGAFRVDATLDSVSGLTLTSAAFASKADGWFTGGSVEFSSGEVRYIENHTGNKLTIAYPVDAAAGAVVAAYPGCDGLEVTCKGKFNNIINFSGFTRIPLTNPYTSSVL